MEELKFNKVQFLTKPEVDSGGNKTGEISMLNFASGQGKSGTTVNSPLFIGYKDNAPIPVVFADDISWKIYNPSGTTVYAETVINETPINTTRDLLEYIAALPTTTEVTNTLRVANSLIYKGTLGASSNTLPADGEVGDIYLVDSVGYISTDGVFSTTTSTGAVQVEPGDMVICKTSGDGTTKPTWNFIQTNVQHQNLTIKNNGTSKITYNSLSPVSLDFSSIFSIDTNNSISLATLNNNYNAQDTTLYKISYDQYGRVTGRTDIDVKTFSLGNKTYNPFSNGVNLALDTGLDIISETTEKGDVIDKLTNTGLLDVSATGLTLKFKVGGQDATKDVPISLPSMSNTDYGAAKVNTVRTTALAAKSDSDKTVEITSDGFLVVNVPTVADLLGSTAIGGENTGIYWNGTSFAEVTLPDADSDTKGVIQLGYTSSGTNYAVQVDDDQNAFVTVNWSNTWRPVYAYSSDATSSKVLESTNTETNTLKFSREFYYHDNDSTDQNSGELHITWAEIASDGTVTYTY